MRKGGKDAARSQVARGLRAVQTGRWKRSIFHDNSGGRRCPRRRQWKQLCSSGARDWVWHGSPDPWRSGDLQISSRVGRPVPPQALTTPALASRGKRATALCAGHFGGRRHPIREAKGFRQKSTHTAHLGNSEGPRVTGLNKANGAGRSVRTIVRAQLADRGVRFRRQCLGAGLEVGRVQTPE